MAGLLDALLRNESGGRNIANTTQGTSSGQAQGYFQITTGTWNEFGGQKYAPTPLQASYDQQAEIASKIPLKRWDESTVALMRATGKPIDPDRTLGENLAANGETLAGRGGGTQTAAAGTGAAQPGYDYNAAFEELLASRPPEIEQPRSLLADTLSSSVSSSSFSGGGGITPSAADQASTPPPVPDFASATPETPAPEAAPGRTAAAAAPTTPLAELFTVKEIGMPNEIDPVTGQVRPYRSRRAYG